MDLVQKIAAGRAVVSVIGLGYVGLPLAVRFAEEGFRVVGIDVDQGRVDSINRGVPQVQGVSSDALERLMSGGPSSDTTTSTGKLSVTTGYDALSEADAVIVCVPTPLSKTRDPNLSYIVSAIEGIASRLHHGMLVVLESTSYPGTTEDLVLPLLQKGNGRRLIPGSDFFLAFSPERTDPGRDDWTISNTPKVIGGMTDECLEVAKALYQRVVSDVVSVSSPRAAEMVKLLENTFRATNIALANEIAIMCDRLEVDVWEVIDAAKTKPFGFMPFYPGPGLGGHCIPVDPQYLAWKMKTLDYTARFIQLADEINLGMPLYWVGKVQDELNQAEKPVKGSTILLLGVAYKPNVSDTRESPALEIAKELLLRGANVQYHDPYVPTLRTETYDLDSVEDADLVSAVAGADCVVIVTDHSQYNWDDVRRKASLIVDTRNALGRPPATAGMAAASGSAVRQGTPDNRRL